MIRKDLLKNISSVAESTGLKDDQVLEAMTQGLIAGCKKTHKVNSCRVEFKEDKNELLVYKQYLVVDDYDFDADKTYTQMLLEDARKEKSRIKAGEILEIKINPEEYGHYAIRDMKQKYNEIIGNFQKQNLLAFYRDIEGEILKVRIIDSSQFVYYIDLGKETSILPKSEVLERDKFHIGDEVYVYVSAVEMTPKGPKVYVSRKHNGLILKLMEKYIPEIQSKVIEIVGISREPGDRTKIGIKSNNPQVDPIGACVGEAGVRIKSVLAALSGEKIDLFRWSNNERELIKNALQPADVIAVTKVNPHEKTVLVIVPDEQLSLAIGKSGQNVKLAVQACRWNLY